jgi:hypothetical protein
MGSSLNFLTGSFVAGVLDDEDDVDADADAACCFVILASIFVDTVCLWLLLNSRGAEG